MCILHGYRNKVTQLLIVTLDFPVIVRGKNELSFGALFPSSYHDCFANIVSVEIVTFHVLDCGNDINSYFCDN